MMSRGTEHERHIGLRNLSACIYFNFLMNWNNIETKEIFCLQLKIDDLTKIQSGKF